MVCALLMQSALCSSCFIFPPLIHLHSRVAATVAGEGTTPMLRVATCPDK